MRKLVIAALRSATDGVPTYRPTTMPYTEPLARSTRPSRGDNNGCTIPPAAPSLLLAGQDCGA